MHALGESIHAALLLAAIVNTKLGVGDTTAIARLDVRLVLLVAKAPSWTTAHLIRSANNERLFKLLKVAFNYGQAGGGSQVASNHHGLHVRQHGHSSLLRCTPAAAGGPALVAAQAAAAAAAAARFGCGGKPSDGGDMKSHELEHKGWKEGVAELMFGWKAGVR